VTPAIPQPDNPPEERPLGSWKEIAAFFDVSVRAVQLWEQERGLPVRRNYRGRGRVYAYVSELQAWREGTFAGTPVEEAEVAVSHSRARWLLWAAPLSVLLVAVVLLGLLRTQPRIPSAYRIDGQSLIVNDQEGRILWTHRFDHRLASPAETKISSPPAFIDVDGDGAVELLFPVQLADYSVNKSLICFSSTGTIRWEYQVQKTVRMGGMPYGPPFYNRVFAVVPGPRGAPSRIVAGFNHETDCPSQAVLLDHKGKVLREYWHAGHFQSVLVTDLVAGNGPEIYLGAISNADRTASLIVIDPESFGGAAGSEDPAYHFSGMEPARELGRVLLQRLLLSQMTEAFNIPSMISRQGERLVVGVEESPTRHAGAAQIITFGPRLTLLDLSLGSTTYAAYRTLHAQGILPTGNPDPELPNLRKLRYLTPWPESEKQATSR